MDLTFQFQIQVENKKSGSKSVPSAISRNKFTKHKNLMFTWCVVMADQASKKILTEISLHGKQAQTGYEVVQRCWAAVQRPAT